VRAVPRMVGEIFPISLVDPYGRGSEHYGLVNSYYSQDSSTVAFDCQTEKDVSRQRADSADLIGRLRLWQLGLDLQPCC
jgi:hypothetical protein